MKLDNKYIIGCHCMFYEIDMVEEYLNSLKTNSSAGNPELELTKDVHFMRLYQSNRGVSPTLHLMKTCELPGTKVFMRKMVPILDTKSDITDDFFDFERIEKSSGKHIGKFIPKI